MYACVHMISTDRKFVRCSFLLPGNKIVQLNEISANGNWGGGGSVSKKTKVSSFLWDESKVVENMLSHWWLWSNTQAVTIHRLKSQQGCCLRASNSGLNIFGADLDGERRGWATNLYNGKNWRITSIREIFVPILFFVRERWHKNFNWRWLKFWDL